MAADFALNKYLQSLYQDISASVERLRQKEADRPKKAFAAADDDFEAFVSAPRVQQYAYQLLATSSAYTLQTEGSLAASPSAKETAASYAAADNVLNEPQPVLDLLHRNNRIFDFRV